MFQRDRRLFIRSFINVLIIGGILLAACVIGIFMITKQESGGSKPLSLALVNEDNKDNTMTDFVLNVIAENEFLSQVADIQFFDTEEEAVEAVKNGLAGALIIPEDFFHSVYEAKNKPCRLILNQSAATSAETIQKVADLGSDLLSAVQYAIYEGDAFLVSQGADTDTRNDYNTTLNTSLVGQVANCSNSYFAKTNLGFTTSGLSVAGHYFAAFLGFFFGLLAICFFHLYQDDCKRSTLMRLFAAGVTRRDFLRWKILLPAGLYAVITLVVGFCLDSVIPLHCNAGTVLSAAAAILFAAAFCALLGTSLGASAGAVTFIVFFLSMFFIGGILPYTSLNPIALTIGRFTPLGAIYDMLSPLLGGSYSFLPCFVAAGYLMLGIIITNRAFNRMILGKETI